MAIVTLDSKIYSDLIGKPFKLGARGPDFYDCYGLVMEIMGRRGVKIPDYRSPGTLAEVAALSDIYVNAWIKCQEEPGVLVLIRIANEPTHVGMVLPFGNMIHSWEPAGGVCIEPLDEWRRRVIGFYKFPQ